MTPPAASPPTRLAVLSALTFGTLLSLALHGYQVGKSNHTVYLLDALRHLDGTLLANDWFTNATLQYHGLFSLITRWSLSAGVFEPVFLAGHLLTALALHYYLWRTVAAVGGSLRAYAMAAVLIHVPAAGFGLGGFQFLQDGAFLPSNIANVAMLAGVAYLMERRAWPAGVALGLAGVFHINHAVFAGPVFLAGVIAAFGGEWRRHRGAILGAGLVMAAGVASNVVPAFLHLRDAAGAGEAGGRMPLAEFVELYARLRHPHHYYPRAWHPLVYVGALWSLVPAAYFLVRGRGRIPGAAFRVVVAVGGLLLAANVVALAFAGVVFVSERLIQLAVFRFSIHFMALAVAVTAWGLVDSGLVSKWWARAVAVAVPLVLGAGWAVAAGGGAGEVARGFVTAKPTAVGITLITLSALCVLALIGFTRRPDPMNPLLAKLVRGAMLVLSCGWMALAGARGQLGLAIIPEDPPEYVALARWARENTPHDAVFVVPPGEQAWRFEARRAVVINLKAIPQTSAELPEWARRMRDVTGENDLAGRFAGDFASTLRRLDEAYTARPESELVAVARKYNARYIVTMAELPGLTQIGPGPRGSARYRLYDLTPAR